jgi:1,5-anhydro-D-fructose reductase (1,5-anhydro-D-mannitol-forming)
MPLRIAVVGHGLIGRQRAAAVHALSAGHDVALVATVDPQPRRAGVAYADVPHLASLDDLAADAYDAAIVALPHDSATALTKRLLTQGTPVLVEKPLGLNGHDAAELTALAATPDRPSFVGYNYRFLPHVRGAFSAVTDGTLGRLRSIDLLIGHGGHPGSAEGWKLDPERAGGGVLLDPGVHLLDLLLLLDGTLQPLVARGTKGFWGTGIEEDLLVALARDELQATVRVSHVRWINTLRLELVGEDGYAIAEGRGGNYGPMTLRVGRRWAWKDDPDGRAQRDTERFKDFGATNVSLEDETKAVVRAWLGDAPQEPHPSSFAEALAVARLVDDLYDRMGPPQGTERAAPTPAS